MLGLIVCGHGKFGSCLTSSLKLIAGIPNNYEWIDFEENDNIDSLENKFHNALDKLKKCTEILIFTDILGGSPFKTAVQVSVTEKDRKVVVLSGTNLGMLIETTMLMNYMSDIEYLSNQIIEAGKSNVVKYIYEPIENDDIFDEGI